MGGQYPTHWHTGVIQTVGTDEILMNLSVEQMVPILSPACPTVVRLPAISLGSTWMMASFKQLTASLSG